MATSSARLTAEDYKKARELREARQAGQIEPEKDEEGRNINPHIPQYIVNAPWYSTLSDRPTLSHQRIHDKKEPVESLEGISVRKRIKRDRFVKGACSNCGSTTHATIECMERPRKIGAKWTGKVISSEITKHDNSVSFEEKRDRWKGYDLAQHNEVLEQYERMSEERKKMQAQKLSMGESDNHDSDTEDDLRESATQIQKQKFDEKTRTSVRNLRIREDTAKFLHNLDLDSAFFDPKSRSMRENPFKGLSGSDAEEFAGDNFVAESNPGEVIEATEAQIFAWEQAERGKTGLNMSANPTASSLYRQEMMQRKEKASELKKQMLLNQYGKHENEIGEEESNILISQDISFELPSDVEAMHQSEKSKGQITETSKYVEDEYNNGHSTIWGSYWEDGRWGYNCCKSTQKDTRCPNSLESKN